MGDWLDLKPYELMLWWHLPMSNARRLLIDDPQMKSKHSCNYDSNQCVDDLMMTTNRITQTFVGFRASSSCSKIINGINGSGPPPSILRIEIGTASC